MPTNPLTGKALAHGADVTCHSNQHITDEEIADLKRGRHDPFSPSSPGSHTSESMTRDESL